MPYTMNTTNPFDARALLPTLQGRMVGRLAAPLVGQVLGLHHCGRRYRALPREATAGAFAEQALAQLDVRLVYREEELTRLPRNGPAVVIANHPFGGLDGLALIALLRRLRPDVKILANYVLARIPQLREALVAVDPFGRAQSGARNIAPLRQGIRWVREGGMLVVFPAGEVSHWHLSSRHITDPAWDPGISRLIRHCRAPVHPVHFSGNNSLLFQLAGLIHPLLRTAMLPRELLRRAGTSLEIRIGGAVPSGKLERFASDEELAAYLRLRTYLLADAPRPEADAFAEAQPQPASPLCPAVPLPQLERDLAALPPAQRLLATREFEVWHARAEQIPALLTEIGRLREKTFRAVGEGTGRTLDLDTFDEHYRHLFLWNHVKRELAGAYRLGPSDEILARYGREGFYTHTLFHYEPSFFTQLGPALELGRSFVRSEYQRSFAPLLLLWQGIGQFLVRHPRYRRLFGPVSISRDYSDLSRQMMAAALRQTVFDPALARLVSPRRPFPSAPLRLRGRERSTLLTLLRDIDQVDALIGEVEPAQKGIPVLLRHYLSLGGRILEFNLDHDFQDALDALVLVELDRANPRVLERYLGKEGLASYLQLAGDSAFRAASRQP